MVYESSRYDVVDCLLDMSCAGRAFDGLEAFTLQIFWTQRREDAKDKEHETYYASVALLLLPVLQDAAKTTLATRSRLRRRAIHWLTVGAR